MLRTIFVVMLASTVAPLGAQQPDAASQPAAVQLSPLEAAIAGLTRSPSATCTIGGWDTGAMTRQITVPKPFARFMQC